MPTKRAHIIFPEDLISEIDALVGPRRRTAFLLEITRKEVQRQKLLQFLERSAPAWKDKDHEDMGGDSAAWVRKLRQESEHRDTAKVQTKK